MNKPDIRATFAGPIAALTAETDRAREWVTENVASVGWTATLSAFITAARPFAETVIADARAAGLAVLVEEVL